LFAKYNLFVFSTCFPKNFVILTAMKKKELTAADVWAMFAESDRQRKENERILNEKFAETRTQMQETDRRMKENAVLIKELREGNKELGIQIGGINDNIGHHAEQFFQDVFGRKLEFGMVKYDEMIPNLTYIGKGAKIEFDIALINGNSIALIEVKSRIYPNFVKVFAEERIEIFRKFFTEFKDYSAYLGIAGFSFSDEVLEQASKYGIGIIKQVGEGVEMSVDNLRVY
jgi:hypothetical protein